MNPLVQTEDACAGAVTGPLTLEEAAAIADAGSCISLVRQRNADGSARHRMVLHLTRNGPGSLEDFQAAVGTPGKLRQIRIGHLTYWRLAWEGRKAYTVISMLRPHLKERALEAVAAERWWRLGRHAESFGPAGTPPDVRAIRDEETARFESLKAGLRTRSRSPSAARPAARAGAAAVARVAV